MQCHRSGNVLTATFLLDDIVFSAWQDGSDFYLEAEGEDATVSFVRVVKLA